MRVAMYYNNRDVRLEEMAVPGIGPGEMLVKIMAKLAMVKQTNNLTNCGILYHTSHLK